MNLLFFYMGSTLRALDCWTLPSVKTVATEGPASMVRLATARTVLICAALGPDGELALAVSPASVMPI